MIAKKMSGRKQMEKEHRRRAILEAARGLLLEKGYDTVSIRQIAGICELGTGTIYSYFSGKLEIYATLSTEVFDLLHDHFQAAFAPGDEPTESLRAIGAALLDFSVRHRAYYDFLDYFISSSRTIFPAEMKSRIDEYGGRVLAPIRDAIEAGIRTGEFIRVDSTRYALLFVGMMHGVIHFRKLKGTLLTETGFDALYRQGVESMIDSLRVSR
ncbi:MAG TPA: TetR/AcrR family transcriptional regulator [Spirochaetota bacterium]|nr:TetR/AcrR family transcriptional regulator [Spirochaetota bacterium]